MRNEPRITELDLDYLGIACHIKALINLPTPQLIEHAIKNNEGNLSLAGALMVKTGKYTGRSPNDKFIVDHGGKTDKEIDWGKVNVPFPPEKFDQLLKKVLDFIAQKTLFVQDVCAGSHPKHQRKIRIISEKAWLSLLAHDLLIPNEGMFTDPPDFTLIQVSTFNAIPQIDGTNSSAFILVDFEKKIALIGCTEYGGEIKKTVFTVMNRLLPDEGVLPMHCSANSGTDGDTALFFGLSGTGKTSLSSDPDRFLIGDDEHGWAKDGIFNFEGGCYAKTINLRKEWEPIIWEASQEFGSVIENVVYNEETRVIDFTDASITENTRAAYTLDHVKKRITKNISNHPNHVFFLSADAFGVLPPISRLTPNQAAYFFLSGYTAKLAGTERDLGCEPQSTFSTCFGAPFMPLNPVRYANMLKEKISEHNSRIWLVNTGWTGGPYGIGSRIKIDYSRAIISAALKGSLDEIPFEIEPIFKLEIPSLLPGVPAKLLNPIKSWENPDEYQRIANNLIMDFRKNISQYKGLIDDEILNQL